MMNQRDRGTRQQAPDRLAQRREYIRKKRRRERRREQIRKAAKKAMTEVLLPAGLGIASGLALICAFIYDPGYQEPEYHPQMIKAQGGEYWYPADQYEGYLQEKAAHDAAKREEEEALLQAIREAQQEQQDKQQREWLQYATQNEAAEVKTMTVSAGPDMSDDEQLMIAKMAMAEAEGEDTEGKTLVMLVILNRVKNENFPDTIEDVIAQPDAFTSYTNGRYAEAEPDDDCWAAMDLITTDQWDESQGALYFERTADGPTWHSEHLQRLFEHGNHTFYKEVGA
nr:cell wall hydrolase [uncultured Dysosmobacter sp.]